MWICVAAGILACLGKCCVLRIGYLAGQVPTYPGGLFLMKYRWACGPDSSDLSLCVSGKETGNHQVPCMCQSRPNGYLFSPGVSLTLNYLIGLS